MQKQEENKGYIIDEKEQFRIFVPKDTYPLNFSLFNRALSVKENI